MARRGITEYSEKIKGTPRNYNWAARFDITDGCLGISQFEGERVIDRVLLSPHQVQELLDFIEQNKARRVA